MEDIRFNGLSTRRHQPGKDDETSMERQGTKGFGLKTSLYKGVRIGCVYYRLLVAQSDGNSDVGDWLTSGHMIDLSFPPKFQLPLQLGKLNCNLAILQRTNFLKWSNTLSVPYLTWTRQAILQARIHPTIL
jgi:hypothetical protein